MIISTKKIHSILPVFRLENESQCVLYTPPGHLAVVDPDVADEISQAWSRNTSPEETTAQQVAAWLQTRAEQTAEKWQQWIVSPFTPECLTIHLSHRCNLACSYCYTHPKRQKEKHATAKFPVIREDVVLASARIVAQHCTEHKKPFYLVLHGGGEPTLHWELVEQFEASTRQIAKHFGLGWYGHIATNGIFSAQKARWLAQHFNSIGLSCDGPPDIQDRQRPFQGGEATSTIIKQTARILKNAGGNFTIRTTITPQTIERQTEIVAYLHEHLSAEKIRFEPVYSVRETGQQRFSPNDAGHFVEHFLEAQREAQRREMTLTFSGVRLEEIHGAYCDVLRNVLHLNPDGTATACFSSTDSQETNGSSFVVGYLDGNTRQFILDHDRLGTHRQRALDIPIHCHNCPNMYHCTRGCPEFCHLPHTSPIHDHFRCQVHQQLATAWILEAAEKIVAEQEKQTITHSSEQDSAYKVLKSHLHDLPPGIDADAIVHQWKAVRTIYHVENRRMPAPIWTERGFEHDGFEAWQHLGHDIPLQPDDRAMAIYIHVPFCDRTCGFCDCFSRPLGKDKRRHHENTYLQKLLAEIHAWSKLFPLNQHPVSTVHLGGGTPNCLNASSLTRILEQCYTHFNVTSHTEFALESTSSLLHSEHVTYLRHIGFSRLHVGVQTLEEPLRNIIGRRENAETVLEKLTYSLEKGFVTSIDLIYGLPGQTLPGLIATLERLIEIGIHGISLYRLNRSQRNRHFFEEHRQFTPNALYDYILFQVAEQVLTQAGYHKNHFTHFAKSLDQNLYYTHARRGEDLLGCGTTADGVFGDYHYRHPEYKTYIAGGDSDIPMLEGGIRETALEHRLSPAIAALLTGGISPDILPECKIDTLLDRWQESLLIKKDLDSAHFTLTANGSWFVTDMISELKAWMRR